MSEHTANLLVHLAGQEKAADFQAAFNAMMLDKAAEAIEARRKEVAQNYFDKKEVEPDENTETAA